MTTIVSDAAALAPDLVELRRDLHRHPEVGLRLPRTQERVLGELAGLPLEISTGTALSSIVAVLRGSHPGRTVLVRADMDALPLSERSGVDYAASGNLMHACGHDLHTAMLVGAARLLAARRDVFAGDVVLMFQPGEEAGDGARHMIEEGVLTAGGARVDAAYALHVTSSALPAGYFAGRSGVLFSSSSGLAVTVRGCGGHGGRPHEAQDPIVVAAEIVTALQTMVTRTSDPLDPVVVTVGRFSAGEAANAIPDEATFEGSLRCFSEEARKRTFAAIPRLVHGIAGAHGLDAVVELTEGYPVTRCDPAHTELAAEVVRTTFGDDRWVDLPAPLTASEDFSRVLEQVPGAMLILGAAPADGDPMAAPANHAADAVFDDAVLPDGAAALAAVALAALDTAGPPPAEVNRRPAP